MTSENQRIWPTQVFGKFIPARFFTRCLSIPVVGDTARLGRQGRQNAAPDREIGVIFIEMYCNMVPPGYKLVYNHINCIFI